MPATEERKVPLKADLLKAQRAWTGVMDKVIGEGRVQKITQGGKVVAVVVPIDMWKRANGIPG